METSPRIVFIDDDQEVTERPLYFKLEEKYGQDNIIWHDNPNSALEYIEKNLDKKTIILLDYDFGSQTSNGLEIFQKLQEVSSLLYIILYTAKSVNIPNKQLITFINDHLMGLVDKTSGGYEEALLQVENAVKYLNNRVDCILEEWILRHKKFKREEPYLRVNEEKSYSLSEILSEIRQDTEFGRRMSSNIISTAITLLQRDIEKLDE